MPIRLALLLSVVAFPAVAEVPKVVADVGPIHSMVARVMDGLGAPTLIVPPGLSPHGHALRPSEASALQDADVVVRVGGTLAPWLDDAVGTLAPKARSLVLLDVPETQLRTFDEDHGHGDDDDPHKDHDADAVAIDPHAWLDPDNGKLWLDAIADTLSEADPENAIIYAANAEAGRAELDGLKIEIEGTLAPVRDRGFIVFHDAYGYFEEKFSIPSAGAINVSDAAPPSAARVAALRDAVVDADAVCVFSEPQFNTGLVTTLTEGTGARSGVLDPLGAALQPGPALYPALLRGLATSLSECLAE
ncbi:zinc ABC transporter substrate-binding protein [Jannaschia rubra]|uniref:zinc ABC transporter substrate-binding protein n=1 Tax=Jannaschia rubra TaxID=282197 RepID=UPI002490ABE0|nr:zinc ABC transporter substrate-binding protein [Jannaschia rubra]